jgi:hypothetical protein
LVGEDAGAGADHELQEIATRQAASDHVVEECVFVVGERYIRVGMVFLESCMVVDGWWVRGTSKGARLPPAKTGRTQRRGGALHCISLNLGCSHDRKITSIRNLELEEHANLLAKHASCISFERGCDRSTRWGPNQAWLSSTQFSSAAS